jgi:transcriptional regulator with XRE-family HTH domain
MSSQDVRGFGREVCRRRQDAGMTQQDLAERAELSAIFVGNVERGRMRRGLSLDAAFKLAKGLGAPLGDLVGGASKLGPLGLEAGGLTEALPRHLRVVRDEPPAKRRRGMRPPPVLSVEQERAAKVAIRSLAKSRYGSIDGMSAALGLHKHSIRQALGKRRRLSAEILLRAAIATSTPVERMITPGPREVVP